MNYDLPLVSIILCNYNYARFIEEAINGVLQQTYSHFELIIVDDGSVDNSKEVILGYNDPRIQTIFQENGGQASAFNAGFAKTKGDLIAFLDSDDCWKANKLEQVVKKFKQDNYEHSVVQHSLEWIDENSQNLGRKWPAIKPGVRDVLKAYLSENNTNFFCTTSGIVCRKSDLEKIFPLDESWKICADVVLTRPLALFGSVCTLNESLGYYRVHSSNNWMNSKNQQQIIDNNQRYIEYTNQWLAKLGYSERIDFQKSSMYRNWKIENLPQYYPQRLWKKTVKIRKQIKQFFL